MKDKTIKATTFQNVQMIGALVKNILDTIKYSLKSEVGLPVYL